MRYLLVFLLLGAGQGLYAQVITYDYLSSTYKSAEACCAHQDSTVSYRITNINTFAKKVLINGRMISFTTQMSAELATLFRIKTEEANDKLDNTKKQVDEMIILNKEAVAKLAVAPAAQKTALTAEVDETTKLVDKCSDYYEKAEHIQKVFSFQKQLTEIMAISTNYNEVLMEKALKNENKTATAIDSLELALEEFEDAYHIVRRQYSLAANAARDAGDKVHEAQIKIAQDQVQKDYETLEKKYSEAIDTIRSLFQKAVDPANYIVKSRHPVFIEDSIDEVQFDIKVGDLTEDLTSIDPFKKTIRVKGGVKVDYTVGPTFKFITDDRYYLDSDKKLQKGTNSNILTPGLAPMMHIYRRTCTGFAWGGMFGINADFKEITDINLGFIAGLSAIIGRSPKVFISSGVSLSNVNRLKKGEYTIGQVYTDLKIENITERVLRPSLFFSISLAISKRNVVKIN